MNNQKHKPIPASRKQLWPAVLAIIILGAICYLNSLKGSFIWDDEYLIQANPRIKSLSNIGKLFTGDIGAGTGQKSSSYRPLQMMTYMLDYSVWRQNIVGYHLTNVLIHIGATLGIFALVYLLFSDFLLAILTAVFFEIHPIHTEAVSYIAGRADPLSLLFIVLAFIAYLNKRKEKNTFSFIALVICYCAALLSREGSIIFPCLLLLYHFVFKEKIKLKRFWAVVIISTIYILLRSTVLKPFHPEFVYSSTLLQRLPGSFLAAAEYLKLLIAPFNLHMEYGISWFPYTHPEVILGFLITAAAIIWAIRSLKTNKVVSFAILWFFVGLLPVANLYPVQVYMAEHWLYLPSIGFFLLAAHEGLVFYRKPQLSRTVLTVAIVAGLFYAVRTIQQNRYWSEPLYFYERTLKYTTSPRILNGLGMEYMHMGRNSEAAELFKKANESDKRFVNSQDNLGMSYLNSGHIEEAIALFQDAIKRDPKDSGSYYNLGNAYLRQGKYAEAIEYDKKALELNPELLAAYNDTGIAYAMTGRQEEALAAFKKVAELNPDSVEANINLGNAYATNGRFPEAIVLYKKALQLKPDSPEARSNLERAEASLGK